MDVGCAFWFAYPYPHKNNQMIPSEASEALSFC